MRKVTRIGLIAFVIIALLSMGTLAALWFAWEPMMPFVIWLLSMKWFYTVETVLLAITGAGLLVMLVSAIAMPGKRSKLTVQKDDGSVNITQSATQATVRHVIEGHHGLSASSAHVTITGKRNPRMTVHAKVDPGSNANLSELGATLQREIASSLQAFTGYPVDGVDITFTGKADAVTPSFTQQASRAAGNGSHDGASASSAFAQPSMTPGTAAHAAQ